MQIEFSDEAYETFQRIVDELQGLTVEITTESGRTFDAILLGAKTDAEWGDTVSYRLFDEETAGPIGPVRSTRVKAILVY